MAKIRYVPGEGEPQSHTQFGIDWGSDALDVIDQRTIDKCKGSPFYEVDGVRYRAPDAPEVPKTKGRAK